MRQDILRQVINVLALAATLLVNYLANALPLNGQLTGAISDRFDVYFVPAGYVFAIWGIIYLWLIAFAIYQALPSQRENPRLRRLGYWFGLSCAANIGWLFAWHYNLFPLSMLVMILLLLLLISIYQRLEIGLRKEGGAQEWLINMPFRIYLAWISVATIANATDLLDYWNWNGWGISEQVWAVIMLAIGTALAVIMSIRRTEVVYVLVFIWAFAGIAAKNADRSALVTNAAWVAVGILGLVTLWQLLRKLRVA